jgi:hypothetical protein
VQKILAALDGENQQLQPVLQQLHPQEWYDKKGAPSTYIQQWQSTQQQLRYVQTVTQRFGQNTDSLSAALDLYFRLESLQMAARALNEGAERYADRPQAEMLAQWLAHDFNDRERLRGYIQDLAATVEQNYKIADSEAQRCRGMISKETPPKSTRKK